MHANRTAVVAGILVVCLTGATGFLALSPTADQSARDTSDCNHNGIDDACDIDCGPPGGPCDLLGCGQSADCNGNVVPDECDTDGFSGASSWTTFDAEVEPVWAKGGYNGAIFDGQ